jgi:hypothetical protein
LTKFDKYPWHPAGGHPGPGLTVAELGKAKQILSRSNPAFSTFRPTGEGTAPFTIKYDAKTSLHDVGDDVAFVSQVPSGLICLHHGKTGKEVDITTTTKRLDEIGLKVEAVIRQTLNG